LDMIVPFNLPLQVPYPVLTAPIIRTFWYRTKEKS
jgi:hypothetical protein